MSKKRTWEFSIILLVLTVIGILIYLAMQLGVISTDEHIHVQALFTDASGLVKEADIAVAGVSVGKVGILSVAHNKAEVELIIKKSAMIRNDVVARIRAKSLLGDKFVELIPQSQTAQALVDGDSIVNTQSLKDLDATLADITPSLISVKPLIDQLTELTSKLNSISSTLLPVIEDRKESIQSLLVHLESISQKLDTNILNQGLESKQFITDVQQSIHSLNQILGASTQETTRLIEDLQVITKELAPYSSTISKNLDSTLAVTAEVAPQLPVTLEQLNGTLTQLAIVIPELSQLITTLNNKEGTLGKLLYEDELYNELLSFIKDIKKHPWKLVRKK